VSECYLDLDKEEGGDGGEEEGIRAKKSGVFREVEADITAW
jgi:hypothetical protein